MDDSVQEIVVVRHGETEWSAAGRHTGLADVVLTERGRRDAQAVGRRLDGQRFARVWTSPLRRAADTCALAGFGDRAQVYDDLVEWDYGDFEGRTRAQIVVDAPGWQVWTDGAPGGESLATMQARVDGVVARLVDAPGRTLIFAHGHLLRALAAAWVELSITEGRRLLLDTAGSGTLGWYHDRRALANWNTRSA